MCRTSGSLFLFYPVICYCLPLVKPLFLSLSFEMFRSEIANETDRLTSLCGHWEPKVEDESIPEESMFISSNVCCS